MAEEPRGQIVQVSVPSEASEGETVTIRVTIRNSGSVAGWIGCSAEYNGCAWSAGFEWLDPGQSHTWEPQFTMPGKDVSGAAYAWHVSETYDMVQDEGRTFSIRLKAVAPPSPGGILLAPRYWNPETGTYQDSPPTVGPGARIGLCVYAKNNTERRQSYYPYVYTNVGPLAGSTKSVDPGYVTFWEIHWDAPQEPGDVTATVQLYSSDGTLLDSWSGKVATVSEEAIGTPRAEIVDLSAPSEASEGEQFTLRVGVRNSGNASGYIACTADWDGNSWDGGYVSLDPGQIYTWNIGITMPGKDLSGKVYAWHWDGSSWICDHVKEFSVKLKVVGPPPIEEAIQIVGVGLRAES